MKLALAVMYVAIAAMYAALAASNGKAFYWVIAIVWAVGGGLWFANYLISRRYR